MTVFIHGTVGPRFSFTAFGRWIKNLLQGKRRGCGAYQEYIEETKKVSLHKYQPINKLGLVRVERKKSLTKKHFGYFGQKTVAFYEKMCRVACKDNDKQQRVFYTFSWNGRLSHKSRVAAAQKLYRALLQERKNLSQQLGMPVEIHLLAHSHGCNVVLNLDRVETERKCKLLVDKAIFFGAPVQSETEKCLKSSVFKRIYHIFSSGDHIQNLDFVSTKDRSSRRIFGTNKKEPINLPKNLLQINVNLGGRRPFHYELWLWGGKRFPYFFYRKKVPIHPMPLSVFAPAIVSLADAIDWKSTKGKACILKFDKYKSMFTLVSGNKNVSCNVDVETLKKEAYKIL